VRTEIPYRDGKLTLVSDFQERITKTRYRASGHVLITFKDILLTSEAAEYDEETREGSQPADALQPRGAMARLLASRVQLQHADGRLL
jgi:hypothetical protein